MIGDDRGDLSPQVPEATELEMADYGLQRRPIEIEGLERVVGGASVSTVAAEKSGWQGGSGDRTSAAGAAALASTESTSARDAQTQQRTIIADRAATAEAGAGEERVPQAGEYPGHGGVSESTHFPDPGRNGDLYTPDRVEMGPERRGRGL